MEVYSNIHGHDTMADIFESKMLGKDIAIAYHEDMDGIIGAVCIKAALKKEFKETYGEDSVYTESTISYIPVQYGKDCSMNIDKIKDFKMVIFIDFCPTMAELYNLIETNENIHIYDHHRTQMLKLKEEIVKQTLVDSDIFNNLGFYYDITQAGCGIAYNQFINEERYSDTFISNLGFVSNYAEDRDLWKWSLLKSKEINAGLDIITNVLELKHDPEEWFNILAGEEPKLINNLRLEYPEIDLKTFSEHSHLFSKAVTELGVSKIRYDQAHVNKIVKAAKKGKIPKIFVGGVEMFILNNSTLISEVGNALTELDYPSCQYFIIHEVKDGLLKEPELVLSFRSVDTLPDVSLVATSLGGGGHRNACGASMKIDKLSELLNGNL